MADETSKAADWFTTSRQMWAIGLLLGGVLFSWASQAYGLMDPPPAVTLTVTRQVYTQGHIREEMAWTFQEQRDLTRTVEDGIVPTHQTWSSSDATRSNPSHTATDPTTGPYSSDPTGTRARRSSARP